MVSEWIDLMHRFKDRLEMMENETQEGSRTWRLLCLERALELLEEDPEASSKQLDGFDRLASPQETADAQAQLGKEISLKDIRTRFDNLGGGIV